MPSINFESLKNNMEKRVTYDPDTHMYEVSIDVCFTAKNKCGVTDLNDPQIVNSMDRSMILNIGFYILEQLGLSEEDLMKLDYVKDISLSDLVEMIYKKETQHETMA